MYKELHVTSAIYYAGIFIRAVPLADIDFGRVGRFASLVLHQVCEQKAHLAAHALALVLSGGYVALLTWLMAASLANLRMRNVIQAGLPIAILAAVYICSATHAHAGDDPSGVWQTQAGDARLRVSRCGSGPAAWWCG